jgi:plastin-1
MGEDKMQYYSASAGESTKDPVEDKMQYYATPQTGRHRKSTATKIQYYQVPSQEARTFTTNEVKSFKETFALFDDGSGFIDEDELDTVMKQLGEESDRKKIQALLSADSFHDGKVPFTDFVGIIASARAASEEQARKLEAEAERREKAQTASEAAERARLETGQQTEKSEEERALAQARKNKEYYERKQAEERARKEEQARIDAEQIAKQEAEEQAEQAKQAEQVKQAEAELEKRAEIRSTDYEAEGGTGADDEGGIGQSEVKVSGEDIDDDAGVEEGDDGDADCGEGSAATERPEGDVGGELESGSGSRREFFQEEQQALSEEQQARSALINQEEQQALSALINHSLERNGGHLAQELGLDVADKLPIDTNAQSASGKTRTLFHAMDDGLVPAKLLNMTAEMGGGSAIIDERALHRLRSSSGSSVGSSSGRAEEGSSSGRAEEGQRRELTQKERTENMTLLIHAAKSMGCTMDEIDFDAEGASEVGEDGELRLLIPKEELLMGLMWQIQGAKLKAEVGVEQCPFLARLVDAEADEQLTDLRRLSVPALLMRWINYHIASTEPTAADTPAEGVDTEGAGGARRVGNFSTDFADGECYGALLQKLHLAQGNTAAAAAIIASTRPGSSRDEAAAAVLASAKELGVACCCVQSNDLTRGNEKLHLLFVAQLFKSCPGMKATDQEVREVEEIFGGGGDSDDREEVVLRRWLNLLGLPGVYVRGLYDGDLADGLVILKAMDKVEPGIVFWKRVNMQTPIKIKFKRMENCNYVVTLGKQFKFSLVNVGGIDIESGNEKLISSIIWQLMQYHLMKVLRDLSSTGDKQIGDKEIIEWANARVNKAGFTSKMKDFKDRTLSDSRFLIDLVRALQPGAVCMEYMMVGGGDLAVENNAKYTISCAHRIGAAVFLSWLDIVEVRPKMIMTFVASLMAVDQAGGIADKKTKALCEALGR